MAAPTPYDGSHGSHSVTSDANSTTSSSTATKTKEKRKHKQQPRQLLSCSKCRERKVRCDRTKPCSACCARGHPKECEFTLGEGTAFGPIQQSLELRRLRTENQQLRERLLNAKGEIDADSDGVSSNPGQGTSRPAHRRFGFEEPGDSLYFGTPSLAAVVSELSQSSSSSPTKSKPSSLPGVQDYLSGEDLPVYPYPTIWTSMNWIEGLRQCLEPWDETSTCIKAYLQRGHSLTNPRLVTNVTLADVDQLMADFDDSATSHPDFLGLCLALLTKQTQQSMYTKDFQDVSDLDTNAIQTRASLFLAASMQALRQASFSSQPTLLGLQAMAFLPTCLLNSGRPLDAWMLLGVAIRMAQALSLHRDPRTLDPVPSARECALRRKLWWFLLGLDQQYSNALGRPLGIAAMGDCPFPEQLTTNTSLLRISECMNQVTIIGRQILGSGPLTINRITHYIDKLHTIYDNIPEEDQFDEQWLTDEDEVPDMPVCEDSAVLYSHIQSYVAMLCHQHLERSQGSAGSSVASASGHVSPSDMPTQKSNEPPVAKVRGAMIAACNGILDAFHYLSLHHPETMVDWILKHQAFAACTILVADMQEQRLATHGQRVKHCLSIFTGLADTRSDRLAKIAAFQIGEGLAQARASEQQRHRSVQMSSLPDFHADRYEHRRDSSVSTHSSAAVMRQPTYDINDLKSPQSVGTKSSSQSSYQASMAPSASFSSSISPDMQRRPSIPHTFAQPAYSGIEHQAMHTAYSNSSTPIPQYYQQYQFPTPGMSGQAQMHPGVTMAPSVMSSMNDFNQPVHMMQHAVSHPAAPQMAPPMTSQAQHQQMLQAQQMQQYPQAFYQQGDPRAQGGSFTQPGPTPWNSFSG